MKVNKWYNYAINFLLIDFYSKNVVAGAFHGFMFRENTRTESL